MNENDASPDPANVEEVAEFDELSASIIESAMLERLLAEVRNETFSEPHAYNRMHNRHNRRGQAARDDVYRHRPA